MNIEFIVEENLNDRIDLYISGLDNNLSRNDAKTSIKEGYITVNSQKVKPSYILKAGDFVRIEIKEEDKLEIKAENLNLDIVYEDNYIAIINKPSGMVVHPGAGNSSGTLVNGLMYQFDKLANEIDPIRPGIVHRLDKETSGLLVIAKDDLAYEKLIAMFKERKVERSYKALVYGRIKTEEGQINAPIGRHPVNRQIMTVIDKNSKEAITNYKVLELFDEYTLIEASLYTGRTHQIRVHMKYINHPIVGDPIYSNGKNEFGLKKQFLHSYRVSFVHPITNEYLEFESKLPNQFEKIANSLLNKRNYK